MRITNILLALIAILLLLNVIIGAGFSVFPAAKAQSNNDKPKPMEVKIVGIDPKAVMVVYPYSSGVWNANIIAPKTYFGTAEVIPVVVANPK